MTQTPSSIQRSAVRALLQYADAEERAEQTVHVKRLAELFVNVREHFDAGNGEPDWLGRSRAYKDWVHETYEKAGVEGETRTRVQNAVRFHTSRVLRERLDQDTLQALGLRPESRKDARLQNYHANMATLRALTASDPGSGLRALIGAKALMARVSAGDVRDLDGAEREVALEAAREVRRKAGNLVRALGG